MNSVMLSIGDNILETTQSGTGKGQEQIFC